MGPLSNSAPRNGGGRGILPLLRSMQAAGLLLAAVVLCPPGSAQPLVEIHEVRYWSLGGVTRVAIQLSGAFSYRSERLRKPERIYFDIPNAKKRFGDKGVHITPVNDGLVQQIRVAQTTPRTTRVVLDLTSDAEVISSQLTNPNRLIVEVRARQGEQASFLGPGKSGRLSMSEPPSGLKSPDLEMTQGETAASSRQVATGLQRPSLEEGGARQEASTSSAERAPLLQSPPKEALSPAQSERVTDAAAVGDRSSALDRNGGSLSVAKSYLPSHLEAPASAASAPVAPPRQADSVLSPEPRKEAREGNRKPAETARLPQSMEAVPVPAAKNSTGRRSLTRALGLKFGKVVIDPGHGGHDHGTTGLYGVVEKDLVLDVARRLAILIENQLQAEVILTRDSDQFVPLEERTELANQVKADLFLSIHANASPLRTATGVETYYLNFTTSRDAMEIAARENAGHTKSLHELQDLIRTIALKDKLEESRDFAREVQKALTQRLGRRNDGLRNRGVRQAPFVVLIGASMPSVLTEIGFLSNPREAKLMATPAYRQEIAEALFEGIANYARALSRFDVATQSISAQSSAP